MAISEDKIVWIDGVPYIQDYSVMPPRIMLHPDYHPTIWFRIKHLYWGLLCKTDDLKIRLHNKTYNYWRSRMRKPQVNNKYNLTMAKIRRLKIADRSKVCEPLFWRNNIIKAWCITGVVGTARDEEFSTDNSFWIGIYDEDAPTYAGKFRFYLTSYGAMCGYTFHNFFCQEDIECENDMLIQERFLDKINLLLDIDVLKMG